MKKKDNFCCLYYRVDVEVLKNWAEETLFIGGSIGYVVQKPDLTDEFRQFLQVMQRANWEKNILRYIVLISEKLFAFITGYGKRTNRLKKTWLGQLDSWSPSVLRAQLGGLAESGRKDCRVRK